MPLLEVRDLRVHFPMRSGLLQRATGLVRAVDGVSFQVPKGSTLGLVGESGSGKSTAGRAVLRLIEPTGGSVRFGGVDVLGASAGTLRGLRRQMQMIFQDPGSSLNPRRTIRDALTEPLLIHAIASSAKDAEQRAAGLLERCGMTAAALSRYPHEFSGGQKQRIAIARALALSPSLIVCDEPTSALDVSIQAQILNLLADLQRDLGLSYLFISHDMGVIQHMCPTIAVMRRGVIVEQGPRERVLATPSEEYTRKLLESVPRIDAA
jgi:ABC-type glutathione transport system ATPase component